MNVTVKIDRENQRFYAKIDGFNNEVVYKQLSPKLIELMHTKVDPRYASSEIEEELLYHTFIFAQKEGITVIPSCDSSISYLNKHKEFLCVTSPEAAA